MINPHDDHAQLTDADESDALKNWPNTLVLRVDETGVFDFDLMRSGYSSVPENHACQEYIRLDIAEEKANAALNAGPAHGAIADRLAKLEALRETVIDYFFGHTWSHLRYSRPIHAALRALADKS